MVGLLTAHQMTWPWDPWRLSVMLSGKGKRCQIISRNANSCDEIWRNHVPTTQNGKSASKSNAVWTCVDWISWISRFKTSIAFGKPSILRFKQPKQNAFKPIPVTVPVDRWFWSQVRFLFLFVFLFTPGATANNETLGAWPSWRPWIQIGYLENELVNAASH